MRLGVEAAEAPGQLGGSEERWREIEEACSQRVVAMEDGFRTEPPSISCGE